MREETNKIIRPRFVALDSSHLAAVARAKFSKDAPERQRAAAFERALEANGGILLLCWHHIQELLSHRDRDVVAHRVAFITSLPMVASIASFANDDIIGSVIDLQSREAAVAFREPKASATAIRDEAAKTMFRLGRGADLIGPFMENWDDLRAEFVRQEERQREVVAISRSDFADISNVKIADLLTGKVRKPEAVAKQFRHLHQEAYPVDSGSSICCGRRARGRATSFRGLSRLTISQ
jgi:hypothetical protein